MPRDHTSGPDVLSHQRLVVPDGLAVLLEAVRSAVHRSTALSLQAATQEVLVAVVCTFLCRNTCTVCGMWWDCKGLVLHNSCHGG